MSITSFTVPAHDRYFEDYPVGAVYEFGTASVTEEEIVAFARQFDPQPMHTDPEQARHSVYGGLIASGWHTGGLVMRLCVDHYLSSVASLGSPGLKELLWLLPVRPGDTISLRVTILPESRRSRSKPDRGILYSFIEALNQDGEVVMSMKAMNLLLCRPAA